MNYVPLKEAAKKHNVDEQVLTQLISAGMINAKKEAGEILVAVDKNDNSAGGLQTKEEIIAAKYGDIQGQPITLSKAAEKYNVSLSTIKAWLYRNNYIAPIIENSHPAFFDEAEIAYLAEIFHKRKRKGTGFFGAPLLDKDGLPYKLKHPDLAKHRRTKK
ncbi:MAG: hypothetical protein Kow0031_09010 [Anaerolineae bacterium]